MTKYAIVLFVLSLPLESDNLEKRAENENSCPEPKTVLVSKIFPPETVTGTE